MKQCKKCNALFPKMLTINEKVHNLQNRKFCLECSPFKSHNTKDLTSDQSTEKVKPFRIAKPSTETYKYVKKFRKKKKEKCIEYLGGKCSNCGYNKCIEALQIHHLNPDEKHYTISMKVSWGFDRIKSELDKCILLCANCHAEEHFNQRNNN